MTNVLLKWLKLPKYPKNHKMSKKKTPRYLLIDQNSFKISKMTKTTWKSLKWPKYPWNDLNEQSNHQNTPFAMANILLQTYNRMFEIENINIPSNFCKS